MLIIEDGTAKADAQSYATVAELVAFATARGITLPATEVEQELLLLSAMDYMETLSYRGMRYSRTQALSWPRVDVFIDGWLQPFEELPPSLKAAQIQLAIDSIENPLMGTVTPTDGRVVVEEAVEGAVSVKYQVVAGRSPVASPGSAGVTATGVQLTRARSLLQPLIAPLGQVRVGRG